jgi:hypothetical protein
VEEERIANRKRYSVLPEINKNTVIKRKEVDMSIIEEDPIFGDFRKKNIRKRLMNDPHEEFKLSKLSSL